MQVPVFVAMWLLHCACATQRVVVTFDTWEQAAMKYDVYNATVVKQYGRRMVLDLGREAELPEDWMRGVFGQNVTVELDALVGVVQDEEEDWYDEPQTTTPEEEIPTTPEEHMPQLTTPPRVSAQRVSAASFNSKVPWNLADSEPYSIHVEGAWTITNSTPDVVVAVLDTGLAAVARGAFMHLAQGFDFISDASISLDGDGRDGDYTDPGDSGPDCVNPSWHGTKVTSILAAAHENAFGVLGVAQNATIVPIRVLGQCSSGYANDITDAIVWAAGGVINGVQKIPKPAKIISMSFAGSGPCPSYLQSAVNQAVGLGAFLVAAAGNEGLDTTDNTFPANCNNVISVGASTRRGKLASYSNKGADIAAPGGDATDQIHVLSVRQGNLSDSYSLGTSMAVPHVAGVAALYVLREVNFSRWAFLERHSSAKSYNTSSQIAIVYASGVPIQFDRSGAGCSCTCDYPHYFPFCDGCSCPNCPPGTYNPGFHQLIYPLYVTVSGEGEFSYNSMYRSYPAYTKTGFWLFFDKDYDKWWLTELGWGGNWGRWVANGFRGLFNSPNSVTWCEYAPPGTYVDSYGAAPTSCPAGTYAPDRGSVRCTTCPDGTVSIPGESRCHLCGAGEYSRLNNCYDCQPGQYAGEYAASCSTCTEGKYSGLAWGSCADCGSGAGSAAGSGSCSTCPAGTYSPSGICIGCPANSNSAIGSTSISACICNTNFYRVSDTCRGCTAGCLAGTYKNTDCSMNADMTCPACPTNSNSGAGAASVAGCKCNARYFGPVGSCTECPDNSNSPLGSTYISQCECNSGFFKSGNTCPVCSTSCAAGKYKTANCDTTKDITCTDCPTNSYSSAASTLRSHCICNGGYYGSLGSSGTCIRCPDNSNSVAGSTLIISDCKCNAAHYRTGDTCNACSTACASGLYKTATCTGTADIKCASCDTCTGPVNYTFSACTATANTVCCDYSIPAGSYASACHATSACPSIPNGAYTFSQASWKLNRCVDFACNDGYYAQPAALTAAIAACQSASTYVIGSTCTTLLNTLCKPTLACSGTTTYLKTIATTSTPSTYILNPSTNDRQCTPCTTCIAGTVQISACTPVSQTICAKCPTTTTQFSTSSGATVNMPITYGWSGQCWVYSATANAYHATLTTTPMGYLAYSLTYKNLGAITSNADSFPTLKIANFIGADGVQTASQSWALDLQINTFIPCQAPPPGRRFKAWDGFQNKATYICSSLTDCANLQAACDITKSTECTGWIDTAGWYNNAGSCIACPISSTDSQCTWGQYKAIDDCRPERAPGCFSCKGNPPGNATWTKSASPHYFLSTATTTCEWDCLPGFYKVSSVCLPCTKPAFSEFREGPSGDTQDLSAQTCLVSSDPATCKFFGGTASQKCKWVCQDGYFKVTPASGMGVSDQPYCDKCPDVQCPAGFVKYAMSTTCYGCKRCDPMVYNATYDANCGITCNAGFFQASATYCQQCSVQTCAAGMYSGGCGGYADSTCQACAQCGAGYMQTSPCSAAANTVCVKCTAQLVVNSMYSANCSVVCLDGFVMSGGNCVACVTSVTGCTIGQKLATTCTAANLGCESCPVPQTYNWCWMNTVPCAWQCTRFYSKVDGKCAWDAARDVVIGCEGSAVFAAPTTSTAVSGSTAAVSSTASSTVSTTVSSMAYFATTASSNTTFVATTAPFATTFDASTATTSTVSANSTTFIATTAPFKSPIIRETISVQNLTMHACTCVGERLAAELTVAYGTPVYMIACESGEVTTQCVDFQCPCQQARRLLQALTTTNFKVVYQDAKKTVNTDQMAEILQRVLPFARLQDRRSLSLETTDMTWNPAWIAFMPQVAAPDITAPIVAVAVVVVVLGVLAALLLQPQQKPVQPQRVFRVKI